MGKLEEFEKWNASGMERYVQQPDRFFAQCSTQRIFFKMSDKKDGIVSELSLKEKMTAFLVNPGIILSLVLFLITTITNLGLINNG